MNDVQIRVNLQSYRAIKSADLLINGITVVAGENGSGKSTLSKLLYYLYKTVSNLDDLIYTELRDKLEEVQRVLRIITSDIYRFSNSERNTREEFLQIDSLLERKVSLDDLDNWISVVENIGNNYKSQPNNKISNLNIAKRTRIDFIVQDLAIQIPNFPKDVFDSFEKIKIILLNIFEDASKKIKTRPTSFFLEELKSLYQEGILPVKFEVFELGDRIVSLTDKTLSIPYSIQNCIYVDTPMMVGVGQFEENHWSDLEDLLMMRGKPKDNSLSNIISSEILDGDISVAESEFPMEEFSYRRNDGSVFNLLECATGIKSFAILQLLLNNGTLTDKSLFIIDEPESHLHPQWIIEYARIIVLLHKQIGVKFFIATHNPDMISAIRYISEKEGVLNNINYYLAEKVNSTFKYEYKSLGFNIDPIFESFNIALDRIDKYGK